MADHVCPWWFSYTFDNPLRKLVHRPEQMLSSYVRPDMICADLGCGRGYFCMGMARLVGTSGKVYAVDRQEKMLGLLRKRVARAGLAERVATHLIQSKGLDLDKLEEQVDFVLCFWMLHEVKGQSAFLREAASLLKSGGRLYVAEPKGHVSLVDFEQSLAAAARAGLEVEARPKVALSRSALLKKP